MLLKLRCAVSARACQLCFSLDFHCQDFLEPPRVLQIKIRQSPRLEFINALVDRISASEVLPEAMRRVANPLSHSARVSDASISANNVARSRLPQAILLLLSVGSTKSVSTDRIQSRDYSIRVAAFCARIGVRIP